MLAYLLVSATLAAAPVAPPDPHDALCAALRKDKIDVAAIVALAPMGRPAENCHFEDEIWHDNSWLWILAGVATGGLALLVMPDDWDRGHASTEVTDLMPMELGLQTKRVEVIDALLAAGADVDAPLSYESTPLELALTFGRPGENGRAADPGFALARDLLAHHANAAALDHHLYGTVALWLVKSPVYPGLLAAGLPVDLVDESGQSVLYDAAAAGDGALVATLLAAGAKPDGPHQGESPLNGAIKAGDAGILRQLLAAGASPLATSSSPLIDAIKTGRTDLADILVTAGADPRYTLAFGETLLHVAAEDGQAGSVAWCIDRGIPVDAPGDNGETPLSLAAQDGYLPVLQVLLARGADPKPGVVPAAAAGQGPTTTLLLDHLDPTRRAEVLPAALRAAIGEGQQAELALLLSRGASLTPGPEGWEDEGPISWAASSEKWEMMDALIHRGVPVDTADKDGHTALYRALMEDDEDRADELVKRGATVARAGGVALVEQVAAEGFPHNLDWLAKHGAAMDTPDAHGLTPLSAAVAQRNDQTFAWLVATGAKVDRPTPDGGTLLLDSLADPYNPLRDALLAAGANPNAHDKEGRSPLDLAILRDDEDSVTALLKAGAWPDRPDGAGVRPLQEAIDHDACFSLLIEAGAGASVPPDKPLHLPLLAWNYAESLTGLQIPFVIDGTLEDALSHGVPEMAQVFLTRGAVLKPEHLLLVVRSGHADDLPWMLARLGLPKGNERHALMREARKAHAVSEVKLALRTEKDRLRTQSEASPPDSSAESTPQTQASSPDTPPAPP